MSGSGIGMIFTNSGKTIKGNLHSHKQPDIQSHIPPDIQSQIKAGAITPVQYYVSQIKAGTFSGFGTMDLGNLKMNKSCGSCGD